MKIFNKEEDKEKVHVQMKDIMELTQSSTSIPASIIDKVFGREMLIVNNDNRDIFVEFDDPVEIEFFRSIEWIIDYKKYRYLTKEELNTLIEENIKKANEIADKYNNYTYDEKLKDYDLHKKYNVLRLKNEELRKLYCMKEGEYQPPFPLVPDSDGFSLGCDDFDNPYKLSVSIDASKYLLYRADGVEMTKEEKVPGNFIQKGLCLAFMNRKDIPQEGNCEMSFDFSSDNKYLIINTDFTEKKQIKEERLKEEKKGFRKVLNKMFNKNKKS